MSTTDKATELISLLNNIALCFSPTKAVVFHQPTAPPSCPISFSMDGWFASSQVYAP